MTGARRAWASSSAAPRSRGAGRSLIVVPLWVTAILAALLDGKAANMTDVFAGTPRATPSRSRSARSPASCPSGAACSTSPSRASSSSAPARRPSREHRRSAVTGQRPVRRASSGSSRPRSPASLVGLLLAWLGHPLEGRPDHRRRRHQHRRARDHELPVPAGAVQEHLAQHAPDRRDDQDPGPVARSRSSGPILFSGTPYLYFTLSCSCCS